VDVTPFSLGIAVADFLPMGSIVDDRFKALIHRNTTIPTTQLEVFSALSPAQRSAEIEVYQGENPIASQNVLLGKFMFDNLVPEKPGVPPRVTVEFDIDVNGMLQVRAVDRGSGQQTGIAVKASRQRLSQTEIQAAQVALPTVMEQIDLPEDLLREAEVLLARAAGLSAAHDNQALDKAADAVQEALEDGDEAMLREALEDLTELLFDLEQGDTDA